MDNSGDERMEPTYCAKQVRRFDRDRFLCALFAPESRREDLFALYAFNVEIARVRESVSEPLLGRIRLQWWREAIEAAAEGRPPQHLVAEALAQTVRRCGLDRDRLDRLIDGRERDMDGEPFSDMDSLRGYAAATSSTLTELALGVLGAGYDAALAAARDVGVAWSLIGLMRAIPHHARQGRCFLPLSLVDEESLDVAKVMMMKPSSELARVVERVADEAADDLKRARGLKGEIPASATPALLPATLADGYLKELKRVGYNPFAIIPATGPWQQVKLALAAFRKRY